MTTPANLLRFSNIRPLVRYVDEDQAVVDVHFTVQPPFPAKTSLPLPGQVHVCVAVSTESGFHDEKITDVALDQDHGMVRFDLVSPTRWWPAPMGNQQLYDISVSLLFDDDVVDEQTSTVGLTSVRRATDQSDCLILLVNGQEFQADSVIPVDHYQENLLLPVSGDSILVVRDHYGPDVLYDAADRAGILLVQCVPIDRDGQPEHTVLEHVTRLAKHPSLAGWCVSPQGELSQTLAGQIRLVDPTHNVFMDAPSNWAA